MKIRNLLFLICFIFYAGCRAQISTELVYKSKNLKIEKLTENTYLHVSYFETDKWGRVPCNGMIVVDKGEAIVLDTPTNDVASGELIDWLKNEIKSQVRAVVATHFHEDCVGGLSEFHNRDIPSFATNATIEMVKSDVVPKNGFDGYLELQVGNEKVINQYIGEGHTSDNIVCYFSKGKTLFGGCLIKSDGAGKGNLEDANIIAWSTTVEKVKAEFPDTKIVIPGHGKPDGIKLYDYTIKLFKQN